MRRDGEEGSTFEVRRSRSGVRSSFEVRGSGSPKESLNVEPRTSNVLRRAAPSSACKGAVATRLELLLHSLVCQSLPLIIQMPCLNLLANFALSMSGRLISMTSSMDYAAVGSANSQERLLQQIIEWPMPWR